jgi:cytochrome c heme-lyase
MGLIHCNCSPILALCMSDINSHPEPSEQPNLLSSGCPWLNKNNATNPIVNPRNNMPDLPQTAAGIQQGVLSTKREVSSIPKTSTDGSKWEYPSPQQFFHALLRRNKTAEEESMDAVVYVHNQVNEDSWRAVLAWERLHSDTCKEPSLQRFVGKSEEPSLKYKMREFFGRLNGEELFDRHDWFVDRCGQKSVRYIIDYYDTTNAPTVKGDEFNVRIDVRPAPDSAGALWDIIRRPWFGSQE